MSPPVGILPVERSTWSRLADRRAGVPLAGTVAVVLTAAATVRSPQLGCAVALVLAVATAFGAGRTAGVTALTVVWLIAPAVRRLLGLEAGYVPEDPLSVAPFAATAVAAGITAWRTRMPPSVLAVPTAAAVGLLIGVPVGLGNPEAVVYGLLAYGAALAAFVVGWSDGAEPLARWPMLRLVRLAAPLLAVYALYQYFVEVPAWDQAWLDSVSFTSIGAPEEGKIRAFATLNSPGLLGVVLALAILVQAARTGLVGSASPVLAIVAAGLAVTYVRGAWLALVVGALVWLVASGARAAQQVGRLAVPLVVAVLALSTSAATFDAFVGRVETFGALGQDDSAQARTALPASVLGGLARQPLGYGLGSAGQASRLSTGEGLEAPDNGYLAMTYQLGFVGAVLVVGALLAAMAAATRRLWRSRDPDRGLVAALFAFFVVALALGDQFYGFAGVLLWYTVGAGLARAAGVRPPRNLPRA